MKKTMLALVIGASVLSGCKTTDVNPLAIADEYQQVQGVDVTYIIPSEYVNDKIGINGVEFATFHKGTQTKQERLSANKISNNSFEVHRRTDNGTSGSGVLYQISYSSSVKGEDTLIQFQPFQTKSYQQGFIGKFDVPNFNVQQYLSTSQFSVKFEINSEYPSDAVKANFDRVLPKKQYSKEDMQKMMLAKLSGKKVSSEDLYVLDVDGNDTWLQVEAFPYRKGSKVVIKAMLNTNPNGGNTVNLSDLIEKIKLNVTEIVDS
ncbi:hypothetical protein [Psychromonas sp. Urea-02u-13]|uniref:hypothetical protein n=1 Tax=Psychromonas sp. Urea-02u-13 TaxID=2058326 RepID=UPI000C322E37|nr:hypothetical protein [Psychromonas sp. Urea-02u-13]PKG36963.1 hypothetical protein CXF74_21400 [Psychromonas sp. Urea-02u-13]